MPNLEAGQRQLLEELLRDGSSRGSRAVGERFRTSAEFALSDLYLLPDKNPDELVGRIRQKGGTLAVSQGFVGGELNGFFLLPLPRKEAKQLLSLLSEGPVSTGDALSTEERDVLTELINMLGGYLTGSLADGLGLTGLRLDAPVLRQLDLGILRKMFEEVGEGAERILVVESRVLVRPHGFTLYFVFSIPQSAWKKIEEKAAEFAGEKAARATKAALLVDDSAFTRKQTSGMLSRHGYAAEEAGSGQEALQKYSRKPYDLVILDLTLPDMDGLDVLRDLMKSDPQARVVVLTAKAQDSLVDEAARMGASDVVFKPLNEEKLVVVLKKLGLAKQRL